MSLKKSFIAVALSAASLLSLAGCDEERAADRNQSDGQALIQKYPGQSRLRQVMTDIAGQPLEHGYSYLDSMNRGANAMELLAGGQFKIELAQNGLPNGATVQVFKDRIVLDSYLSDDVQALALRRAADYILAQRRDHMPYGDGEAFTVGEGMLVQVGKNNFQHQKILLPVAP